MTHKKLLIFDFDGLILDTETTDYRAWVEVFEHHGLPLPLDVWATGVGSASGVIDLLADLERQIERTIDREAVSESRRARFHALLAEESPRPGVLEYLRDAAAMGLTCAVASSADRPWVTGHLERFGLMDHFAVIKTREDVAHTKPAPDLFLAALEACDVSAEEALVFEDSPNGLLAAQRAGIDAVAVPNPATMLLAIEAAHQIESLAGESLAQLLSRFSRVVEAPRPQERSA